MDTNSSTLTDSQRQCLSHILRNASTALQYAAEFVEKDDGTLTEKQLLGCIDGTERRLAFLIDQLGKGSFCCLRPQECREHCRFFGCAERALENQSVEVNPKRAPGHSEKS